MAKAQAQELTVTIASDNKIRVYIDAAVNTSSAQEIGVTRVGDDQTVQIQPAE
jgi:acyl-[acyl carrier protein]--UDP-N-acetylglucosamine O-acyltransferase